MAIVINESDLKRIKAKIGYPLLDSVILEDEDLKDLCIKPALDEYYRWFPIQSRYDTSVSGEFEIPFPDTYTFAVVDTRMTNSLSNITGSLTGNKLADIIMGQYYNKYNSYGGTYGTRYNFNGLNRARKMDTTYRNMEISRLENQRVIVNREQRKVAGFAGTTTKLTIIWAKYSDNFDDVKFERKEDVIKLAQSYVLNHIADTSGMVTNSNLDIEIDVDMMASKAKDLYDEVMESWKEFPKVIVIPKGMGITSY